MKYGLAVGGPIPKQQWDYTFQVVLSGTRFTRAMEAEPGGSLKLLESLQKRAVYQIIPAGN